MNNKKKSFLNGAFILAIAGLICKVIGAVYKIPLRNEIGAVAMGIYTTVYPIYTFLLIFSTSGIPTAISKLVAEERSKGNAKGAHKVFLSSLKMLVFIGGLTTALMLLGAQAIADALLIDSWEPVVAIAFSLLFVSLLSAYRGYYQGMQNMMPTAITQIVEQIIKLIAGFYFAISWNNQFGPVMGAAGALFGITISELVAFITIFVLYQKDKKKFLTFSDSKDANGKYLKRLLAIAIPMTIGGAVKPLVDTVDSVMAKSILENALSYGSNYINALFGFLKNDCGTLINMPSVLTVALSMSLVPAVSDALSSEGEGEVRRISQTGLKLALIFGLPCTVGFFTLAKEILSLLYIYKTDSFDTVTLTGAQQLGFAQDFLMILSFGVLFLAIIQTAAGILQGLGKVLIPVINLAIGMAVKIILNLVLIPIPELNIYAVPLGTVACYAIAAILDVIFVIKHTCLRFDFKHSLALPLLSTAIMAAVIYLLKIPFAEILIGGGISKLVTVGIILVAATVYLVALVLLKVFDENDLDFLPGGRRVIKLFNKLGIKIRKSEN